MKTLRSTSSAAAALALMLVLTTAVQAAPPSYIIIDIGTVQPADQASQGYHISMTGIATGRSLGAPTRAYSWTRYGGLIGLPNLTGRNFCAGNGVNDVGDVVGTGTTTSYGSNPLPILWHNGAVSQLPLPSGATVARANDINNAGVAVGSSGSGTAEYAAMYATGTGSRITALTATGCYMKTAYGINDAGLVVGQGIDPANASRNVGFVYDSVANVSFEIDYLPGQNGAILFDVSNDGRVAGTGSLNQGGSVPMIWTAAGGPKSIPLPPNTSEGNARGVNNAGWVVGNAGGQYSVPWLYDGDTTYPLYTLLPPGSGWDLSTNTTASAMGISEDGIIVGSGVINGVTHAYAMVPDGAVATLVQDFAAVARPEGIELSWVLAIPGGVMRVEVERAPTEYGPWQSIEASVVENALTATVVDTAAQMEQTYYYRLKVTDNSGATFVLGSVSAERPAVGALGVVLGVPTPNPTVDSTSLAYRLPAQQGVQITVHDVRGRLVRTLVSGSADEGEHMAVWDGHMNDGVRAPAGMYFISLKTAQASRTQRVLLVR
jgi:uncharacterized membrane protein